MSTPSPETKQAAEWTGKTVAAMLAPAHVEDGCQVIANAHNIATAKLIEKNKHSIEVMAEVINECADFIQRHYESLFGEEYIRKEDILRNAKLIYELYQSRQLETVTRGTFALHKIEQLAHQQPSAITPDVEQWSAGHDGCGKWAIYVGNETLKGWSGKGKIFVDGLREIDARKLVTAHELALAQAREPLVKALKRCRDTFAGMQTDTDDDWQRHIRMIDAALTGTREKK